MKWLIPAVLLMVSPLMAAPQAVGPINFGGGLNVGTVCSEIDDSETCDSSNFINDLQGAAFKRNGSRRYVDQAVSSNPVNSLYRAYVSTNAEVRKSLLMTSGDKIYQSSSDANRFWTVLSSNLAPNQTWRWVMMNKIAIGMGDGLTDDVKSFDLITGSMTNLFNSDGSTTNPNVNLRAKYPIVAQNYLILGNVVVFSSRAALTQSATYYPSNIHYSLLARPSSMTISRFIEVRTDDGEEITGLGELNKFVHIFKESSIAELDFTVLNLTALGGDQVLRQIVKGFGLYAPKTLANTGDGYIMGTKDGLRFWDGGRKSRLTLQEESRVLDTLYMKGYSLVADLTKTGTLLNDLVELTNTQTEKNNTDNTEITEREVKTVVNAPDI